MKFLKVASYVLAVTSCLYCACNEKVDTYNNTDVVIEEDAPELYKELVPQKGWNRYSGDSARSIDGWVRWWKYLRMKKTVVMGWLNGLKLRVYPDNEVFRALFVRGIYDPNLVVAVNSILHNGSVFMDVGSTMGYFSLLASKVVGSDGCVIAIEPSSRDYSRLVDNVNINNLHNVMTYRLAIADRSGEVDLSIASDERSSLNTLGTSFGLKGVDKVRVEKVRSTTIDELVASENISHIDLLKLDIEGSELVALRGAINTIEKYRPVIMLGTNDGTLKACGVNISDLKEMLVKLRYRAYVLNDEPFEFRLCDDIARPDVKVVFCMHESVVPPKLPAMVNKSVIERIKDFFTR